VTGLFIGPHNYFIPSELYGRTVRDNVVRGCVDILVTDGNGNVFLGKRNIQPWDQWWTFGGAMVPGESPADSCARIAKRDLGLEVNSDRFSFITYKSLVFSVRREEPQENGCHDISLFHLLVVPSVREFNLEPDEYNEGVWIFGKSISLPNFHPAIVEVVQGANLGP